MEMPSIFQFTALESYLTGAYQHRKAQNPSYSYAVWARRLGVRSPAGVCMIARGQRVPGRALAEKLKRDLALSVEEGKYFDILVRLKRNRESVVPSLQLMKELEKQHPDSGFRLIDHDQFRALSHWYYWCLLEWVSLKGFREDPERLARQMEFEVTPAELREALSVLQRLGLLARNRQGRLYRTPKILTTSPDVTSEAARQLHEEALRHAVHSLHKHPVSERDMQTLTFCLHPGQMKAAKKALTEFLDDFCRTFDNPRGKRVYQLHFALFPLTSDVNMGAE